VDEGSVERLRGFDLTAINPRFAEEEPVLDSQIRPGRKVIRLNKQGECVFLDDKHSCRLHELYGYEAKPLNCRIFPFRFVETPAGIYVAASFGCRSIIEHTGRPVAHYRESLERLFAEAGPNRRIPDEISLAPGIPITWSEYELLEADLARLFSLDGCDLEDQLIAGSVYLSMLAEFIREAQRSGGHSTEEVIRTYVSVMQKENYARIFRVVRKSPARPLIQRMFLGMMISFRNTLSKRRRRIGTIARLIYEYIRNILRIGRIHLLPLQVGFYFSDFRRVRFDPDEPFIAHAVRSYVQHILFRKDLVQGGEMLKGYHFVLLYYALIRWYVVGLVAARKENMPQRQDVLEAIMYVEKYYAYHSCFSELFSRYPVLSDTVDSLFSNKTYPATIVRPPVKL
jgi:Fe-S-cluster containining protein